MATEKFTAESPQHGRVLNGVEMKVEKNPDHRKGMNPSLKEPPLVAPPGKHVSAGVVVTEPDGRVWMIQPKNQFGGYKNTFPKGTVHEGEDLQETAIREVHEESGLVVEITGHLADVERTTSVARFYEGRRVGGAPWSTDKHTHAVKLVPIHGKATDRALQDVFGRETTDQQVVDALRSV
jgi:ADP-ribose pyrophosphatase YjhB (NUDIX family)